MFDDLEPRKGQPDTRLSEVEFKDRFRESFFDPRFREATDAIERLADIAWKNYNDARKSPVTVKAGPEFHDPDYDLSREWLDARDRLRAMAEAQRHAPDRVLIISGSPRSQHTCPGEMPKSYRLCERAGQVLQSEGVEYEILDLSRVNAEYGRVIHPCKSCVSTAMPLCHWPCSCYPNHSLGQAPDWMNEIFAKWVSAHGILIVTPVHWYQAPSALKLMIDRLVCADGGNPDPTTTHGKNVKEAKELEMRGWSYPKHLRGRAFAVVVHGDAAGVESLRRGLSDWLQDMELVPAGWASEVEGYIGYYQPYATSHRALDQAEGFMKDVENAARALARQIQIMRAPGWAAADEGLEPGRVK